MLLKAFSKMWGLPKHTLSYQKVSTLTQFLKRHLTCTCATRNVSEGIAYFGIHTLQHSHQTTKFPSKISSNTRCLLFHRLQLQLIRNNVLQKSECLLPNRRTNYGMVKHFWHMPQVRRVHTSVLRQDIPEYLQGSISEVASVDDDLFDDEMENVLANDMEDDIVDFLTSHLIPYEETDTSFTVQCPSCSTKDSETRVQEIFVDKNSGYFVCPWCNRDGPWEELMHLLNSREDSLTIEQLNAYLATLLPIADVGEDILRDSPLKNVSICTLKEFGARVTSDETRVVVPITNRQSEVVGFESISLLHYFPQIIRRYVIGERKAFGLVKRSRRQQKVIVVPTSCDVLVLAEHNISAVSLPSSDAEALEEYLINCGKNEVVLWYCGEAPPRPLLMSLLQAGVSCSLVNSSNDGPVHTKSLEEIQAALKDTIPVFSETAITFQQLKDKIYQRLTNREETYGVPWKRFLDLNALLLGHRPGEMTVLTGPTGSGKTTFMAEYSLDLCSQGVKTLWGSFEVSIVRLCEVMLQQFSGAPLPQDLATFNRLASQFSMLPLHFLTYHGQHSTTSVIKAMTEAVKVWGIQHVIIDNLQFMLGTSDQPIDRWWEQDKTVAAFRRFATVNNCHVSLVVHPKKVPAGQPLSIESVFGGAKVTQEADNVLILQVKDGFTINQSKKILQVVKNRYGGQLGMVPLKFHKDSLTLSSCFRNKNKEKASTENTNKTPTLRKFNVKGIATFQN
ncbi:mitochondrial DNA helicase isoform X1 [Procambarus clarkii]|uniref:mitochondrial DNA helicase isoform X1 n=1 Tax=Procambarus clarkii TaxID=6728 RepID=UPI001E677345|nr:mitochondrial DNA helicase-like [Procambarus clarkii]XP_045613951.1 mitochondrial DNA helicase-like [Procambarus clarkii]XP_045613952.1 mitochondrial DNA helicase-like [Procambarus clarkii]